MKRGTLLVGAFMAALAAGVLPAEAQRSGAGSATREPSDSGERTGGSAVPRDSGGSSSSGSVSSGSSSSGSSDSSSGGRAWSAPSAPSSAGSSRGEYHVAPSHPAERQQMRQRGEGGDGRRPSGGSVSSGGRAVPRDNAGSAPSGSTSRGTSASAGDESGPARRAVPSSSRPRDGRPVTGTAVDRGDAPRIIDYGGLYPYYRSGFGSAYYRSPYQLYYMPGGYGFGLGYFYDPLWYDPYAYDPYGYGAGGYGYGGGYGGYAGSSGSSSYGKAPTGAVRLKIKPREAQVYVDGYFVGDVDSFDGVFQKLGIDAGGHRIQIKADGYEPIEFDVLVTPGDTVTYKGELKRQ